MAISDNAVVLAWAEFCKQQASGVTDIRSMRAALEAAEKHILSEAPTNSDVEELARKWCKVDGHDPDWLVLDDRQAMPVISTPFGHMKSISHTCTMPLWHSYANGILKFKDAGVVVSIPEPMP